MKPLFHVLAWLILLLVAAPGWAKTVTVQGFHSAAIAAAVAQSGAGDTVRLPAGAYTITDPVKPKSETRLVGDGQEKTVLRFNGQKPSAIVAISDCEEVEVAALTLDGQSNPNAHQGISAHNARRLNIHHVTVRNLVKSGWGPHGILFNGENPTRARGVTDSVIADCLMENIGVESAWGAGIRLAWGSSRNRVLRNTIRGTGRGGILANDGSTDLAIQGNHVSGSGGEGLGIEVCGGCDRAVLEDNRIDHWLSVGGCDLCAVRRNVVSDKSGVCKFCGIELIGSSCVVTDNVVDDGQWIGISVSGNVVKNYVFYGHNTIRQCIQWGAQLQGEEKGIACHYFYRCHFVGTTVGRGKPMFPGDEGHGFRVNSNARHLVLEECEVRDNGRLGLQLFNGQVDHLSFLRCAVKNNKDAAATDIHDYTALEWTNCAVEGNGSNKLPPAKPFPQPPPVASFDAPAKAHAGEPVTFCSTSRAAQGDIKAVLWDFNDGAPSTEAQTTHIFHRPGNYRVTLVVWDAAGRGARTERWVRVGDKG
ncbi:MAG: right-handed parallel beta-helix repeat-containing protein [Thermoguttaceae bacterium]|nr:right-handed parallel beta-helix repeat-containing protein [Thermoguttaceae bacterium]